MGDYSGGHITTEEAEVLIDRLNEKMGNDDNSFFSRRELPSYHGLEGRVCGR